MQNSFAHCHVFMAWVVFFRFSLEASSAPLEYKETNHTLHIEALKTTMLEYLGMDRPPDSREKASHQDLIRIYHQYRSMRRNTQSVQRDSRLFFPTKVYRLNTQQGLNGSAEPKTQWFRAIFHRDSHTTEELTLAKAQLHIQTQSTDFDQPMVSLKIQVRIHRNSHFLMKKVLSTKGLNAKGRKVKLDVTKEVEKWLMQANRSLLIVDIGLVKRREWKSNITPQLFLELEVSVGKVRRARDTNDDIFEDDSYCRRKSVTVSFEEIGWSDWIVAPAGYTMYFCDGSCPHNYKPASMHTQVKSRLHRLTKGATPRPCCVPATYEPMILMHYDSRGQLKLTSFNDLIVSECHCA